MVRNSMKIMFVCVLLGAAASAQFQGSIPARRCRRLNGRAVEVARMDVGPAETCRKWADQSGNSPT